jgi:hypothetical protein
MTEPTVTISVARKINLGDYESADLFISLNGIKPGMTAKDMQPLLDVAMVGWDEVYAVMKDEVNRVVEAHHRRRAK